MQQGIRVWDLPTRIFHWGLALTVAVAVISGQIGGNWIDWHARLGLLALGLVAFRLIWGLVGSTYARFVQFFPTPAKIRAYLAGQWHGEGHNPLGALSVFALLGLLTVQIGSGLFANDDIAFTGPLYALVGKELSNRLTGLHHLFGDLLLIVAALHVAAVLFYTHVKKQNLVKPMLTGKKPGDPARSARGGGWSALVLALLLALAAVYGAGGGWLPVPPPPAVTTPNW